MSRSPGVRTAVPVLAALASAELAVRLLRPRERPPDAMSVDVREHFSDEEIARGRAYARPQAALGLARSTLDAAAIATLVRARAGRRSFPARPVGDRQAVLRSAGAGAALSVGLTLPGLPLHALARRRALAIGLATESWRDWGVDLIKGEAIGGVIAAGVAAGATALARRFPEHWWLPGAGASVALGTAVATLAPVLLDPVFNAFEPLPEGATRSDVLDLAAAAGVRVGEVYSVDASRRTTAANAYVAGLGPTKRVVLFDTLLDRYSREEIQVVVAHELAHVRHRDVPRAVAFAALTAPAGTFAVQRLSWTLSSARGTADALPALILAAGILSAPLGALSARLSRDLERRADWFSLELSDRPEAFVAFERTIALQNVADLEPPRLVTLLATHPPTGERIGLALRYQNRRRASPAS